MKLQQISTNPNCEVHDKITFVGTTFPTTFHRIQDENDLVFLLCYNTGFTPFNLKGFTFIQK